MFTNRTVAKLLVLAGLALSALLPLTWKVHTSTVGVVHDAVHVGAFFVCFALIGFPSKTLWKIVAVSLALLMFGILLEWLQVRVYRIPLEYHDIVLDGIGIVMGVFCWIGLTVVRTRALLR